MHGTGFVLTIAFSFATTADALVSGGAEHSKGSRRLPMRTVVAISVSIVLGFSCTRPAVAGEQPPPPPATSAQGSAIHSDELHFEDVLTVHGEIVSVDPANRLVILKGPKGNTLTVEARSEKDLESVKAGDRVVIRYFEGVQIRKRKPGEPVPLPSLKEGIIGGKLVSAKRMIVASVEAIDEADQEVTLKGPDGSLETVMVTNPEYLGRIKVGDQVVITRAQALALSIDKAS